MDCDVMGLPFDKHFDFPSNDLTHTIHRLYETMNQEGRDLQLEIDRHWIALMMVYKTSPLLDKLPWQAFIINPQDVFVHETLPDIGQYIRLLTMQRDSTDVMCRMIQYSLPYVKHNRLTFAKFDDVTVKILVELIQILLGMCLGVHEKTCKKPVWKLRFQIIAYIQILLTNGSAYDYYLFCINNLNLIRIAIVEYFVYFVQKCMPCEYEMLRHLFGTHTNVENICVQFQLNINHFRSNHMQTDVLSWVDLNEKAHVIIEKCNRICKGKPRITMRRSKCNDGSVSMDSESVMVALNTTKYENIALAPFQQLSMSIDILQRIRVIHNTIKWHSLPQNVVRQQCVALHKALFQDTNIHARSCFLHQCLKCHFVHGCGKLSGQLRTDSDGQVSCCACASSDTMVRVNVLGRIVQLYDKKFYFCHFCLSVHRWTSCGQEFTCCNHKQKQIAIRPRQCLLCARVHNLHDMAVLDDYLGVKQTFLLCGRHMPWSHQLNGIYNFETLNKAVQFKMSHCNTI